VAEVQTGEPVQIRGVRVATNDYAIADASGVVFITAADLPRVLEAAEGIAQREAAMAEALLAGQPISEVMGIAYEHMLKKPDFS
jgi:regulator of RNase E activity RraA